MSGDFVFLGEGCSRGSGTGPWILFTDGKRPAGIDLSNRQVKYKRRCVGQEAQRIVHRDSTKDNKHISESYQVYYGVPPRAGHVG